MLDDSNPSGRLKSGNKKSRAPGWVSFDRYAIRPADGVIEYVYSYNDEQHFQIFLRMDLSRAADPAVARELEATAFAIGMAFLTDIYLGFSTLEIRVRAAYLDAAQIEYWTWLYENGLLEHFYVHGIDFHEGIRIVCDAPETSVMPSAKARAVESPRVLVALGGGKDSALLIEMLRKANVEVSASYYEGYPGEFAELWRLKAFARTAGFSHVHLASLDLVSAPQLAAAEWVTDSSDNALYASLYAFTGVMLCLLHGYTDIVVGNERSANFGNDVYCGRELNHQFEKSFVFEQRFQAYCQKYLAPHVRYYSGLMHLWEIQIAEEFIKYPKYLPVFLSCNMPDESRWCARCAKCAVICLLMSAFLDPNQVIGIFGDDLFECPKLFPIFDALLGHGHPKPLECVCTPEECLALLSLTIRRFEAAAIPLPTYLQRVRPCADEGAAHVERLRNDFNPEHGIPDYMLPALTIRPLSRGSV